MARFSKAWGTPLILIGIVITVYASFAVLSVLISIISQISSGMKFGELSAGGGLWAIAVGAGLLAGSVWLIRYGRKLRRMAPSPNPRGENNTLSILGALWLLPSLIIWGVWISVFESHGSATQAERVEIFLSFFPSVLQSVAGASKAVLISSVGAFLISIFALGWADSRWKAVSIVAAIAGALVTLLQLFSMM
jgi:hypothetical protein